MWCTCNLSSCCVFVSPPQKNEQMHLFVDEHWNEVVWRHQPHQAASGMMNASSVLVSSGESLTWKRGSNTSLIPLTTCFLDGVCLDCLPFHSLVRRAGSSVVKFGDCDSRRQHQALPSLPHIKRRRSAAPFRSKKKCVVLTLLLSKKQADSLGKGKLAHWQAQRWLVHH